MTSHWDEFSKSLAEESLPRRESLRRLGAALAGAVLSPYGVGTAWALGPDPCKNFCRCRNTSQQKACLAACNACDKDTSRMAGQCGSYVCCPTARCGGVCSDLRSDPNCGACGNDCRAFGQTCCFTPWRGLYCADLAQDFYNCGGCGVECADGEVCVDGLCECHPLLIRCNGACSDLDSDPDNCGACGNVCPGSTPWCVHGECICHGTVCGDSCVKTGIDPFNCGACGNVCGPDTPDCYYGVCGDYCPPGYTFCAASGGYCSGLNDDGNCGGCGWVCSAPFSCQGGVCGSPYDPWSGW